MAMKHVDPIATEGQGKADACGSPPPAPIAAASPFTAVVNEHWNSVYKMLYTMTGNVHDTEDLTQETFLRALRRFDTFQIGTNLRSWLLRIAANAYYDVRRKRQRVSLNPMDSEPEAKNRPPGAHLELAEQSALLTAALEELSETTRLVFHLRAQEDLSFREIAGMANISEEAARWHMHQARTKLLKWIE
jgi:RNA polymerase sigma-70 factor, ECF subfamily